MGDLDRIGEIRDHEEKTVSNPLHSFTSATPQNRSTIQKIFRNDEAYDWDIDDCTPLSSSESTSIREATSLCARQCFKHTTPTLYPPGFTSHLPNCLVHFRRVAFGIHFRLARQGVAVDRSQKAEAEGAPTCQISRNVSRRLHLPTL